MMSASSAAAGGGGGPKARMARALILDVRARWLGDYSSPLSNDAGGIDHTRAA